MKKDTVYILLTLTVVTVVILICTAMIIEGQKDIKTAMNAQNNNNSVNGFASPTEAETEESIMTVEEEREPIGFKIPGKKA